MYILICKFLLFSHVRYKINSHKFSFLLYHKHNFSLVLHHKNQNNSIHCSENCNILQLDKVLAFHHIHNHFRILSIFICIHLQCFNSFHNNQYHHKRSYLLFHRGNYFIFESRQVNKYCLHHRRTTYLNRFYDCFRMHNYFQIYYK